MEENKSLNWIIPTIALVGFVFIAKHWWGDKHDEDEENNDEREIIGGIEMGGTNIKLCLGKSSSGDQPFEILKKTIIKTASSEDEKEDWRTPSEHGVSKYHAKIIKEIVTFLNSAEPIKKVGIASFGPICLDKNSPHYGSIMNTPKEKWRMFNLVKSIEDFWGKDKPTINMDTDVNAVAKFEFHHGGHKVTKNLAYITVGTGIGVGVVVNGETCTGLTHPEGGHVFTGRHPKEFKDFKSVWDFHDCCIEGFSTNVAIAKRHNINIEQLPEIKDDDVVWELVAHYLAVLCLNVTLMISPEVIVIGGGVMNRGILFPMIRKELLKLLNGYISHNTITEENIDKYIVRSKYEDDVGMYSALSCTS